VPHSGQASGVPAGAEKVALIERVGSHRGAYAGRRSRDLRAARRGE
jgi:hypothetical protein